jgi:hypothetical protein
VLGTPNAVLVKSTFSELTIASPNYVADYDQTGFYQDAWRLENRNIEQYPMYQNFRDTPFTTLLVHRKLKDARTFGMKRIAQFRKVRLEQQESNI